MFVDWIQLAQNRDQWRGLIITGNFSTTWTSISFSTWILFYGVSYIIYSEINEIRSGWTSYIIYLYICQLVLLRWWNLFYDGLAVSLYVWFEWGRIFRGKRLKSDNLKDREVDGRISICTYITKPIQQIPSWEANISSW